MKTGINRQLPLPSSPVGDIKESDFEYREEPIPSPQQGEVLVRSIYLSLDRTNRLWMSDMEQYMPPVEMGEVMRGGIIGVVEESKNQNFKQGDLVSGLLGWQDYAIAEGNSGFSLTRLPDPLPCPLTAFMGPLGFTGCTAYFGLLDIGQPKVGETVVVSAAAGQWVPLLDKLPRLKVVAWWV